MYRKSQELFQLPEKSFASLYVIIEQVDVSSSKKIAPEFILFVLQDKL